MPDPELPDPPEGVEWSEAEIEAAERHRRRTAIRAAFIAAALVPALIAALVAGVLILRWLVP